jgi:hypothetical protein
MPWPWSLTWTRTLPTRATLTRTRVLGDANALCTSGSTIAAKSDAG